MLGKFYSGREKGKIQSDARQTDTVRPFHAEDDAKYKKRMGFPHLENLLVQLVVEVSLEQ
jgi:hypothetical protein